MNHQHFAHLESELDEFHMSKDVLRDLKRTYYVLTRYATGEPEFAIEIDKNLSISLAYLKSNACLDWFPTNSLYISRQYCSCELGLFENMKARLGLLFRTTTYTEFQIKVMHKFMQKLRKDNRDEKQILLDKIARSLYEYT